MYNYPIEDKANSYILTNLLPPKMTSWLLAI
jgi:hypothetical protein